MKLQTTRFGEIEVPDETLIEMPGGMVGFPLETRFAWLPHPSAEHIVWLQSVSSPAIAFPLFNAARVDGDYPDVPMADIAKLAGVEFDDVETLALLVVLSASPAAPATVNLMAPIVVNSTTRQGAQVVLTQTRFTTATFDRKPAQAAAEAP